MNYKRIDLLSLAWEMGIPIKSDGDLIDFESDLIINGDLNSTDRLDDSVQRYPDQIKETDMELKKLVKDIHKVLFENKSGQKFKSEEAAIESTKASLILRKSTKKR